MFSLSKKVSSQVRAGVKRGFPLTVCLLQKKTTQFLPSPFRTILHVTCHWPGCNRWLSAQHPGDRAVKYHQIKTSKSLNSLHQIWMMAPCLFLEGVSLPWINESNRILYFHTPAALGVYFCCNQWLCCLQHGVTLGCRAFYTHQGSDYALPARLIGSDCGQLSLKPRLVSLGALLFHSSV